MVARENYKSSAPWRARILAYAINYTKKVAVTKSREIARVAYLGQITNIGSYCARKLIKERSRGGRDISGHDCLWENGCHLKIARNSTGSKVRPNNEYWKWSRAKIRKGPLLGGSGY